MDLWYCGLFDTLPFVLTLAFFLHFHLCVDGAVERIIHTQVSCRIIPRSLVFIFITISGDCQGHCQGRTLTIEIQLNISSSKSFLLEKYFGKDL